MFWAVSCLLPWVKWPGPHVPLFSARSCFASLFPSLPHTLIWITLTLSPPTVSFPNMKPFLWVFKSILAMVPEHCAFTIASRTLTSSLGAQCFSSLIPTEANLLTENHAVLSGYHFVNLICLARVTLMLNVTLLPLRLPSSLSGTIYSFHRSRVFLHPSRTITLH